MIKTDIVDRVVDACELERPKALEVVDALIGALKDALRSGERIELRGFGVFVVRRGKSGVGRNPKTGVEVAITPRRTVRFKPGKNLKTL